MFITKDLVFIHLPKTGGTFVRGCLSRVYPPRRSYWRRLIYFITVYCPQKLIQFLERITGQQRTGILQHTLSMRERISIRAYFQYFLIGRAWVTAHSGIYHLPRLLLYRQERPKPIIFAVRNVFAREVSEFYYKNQRKKRKNPKRNYPLLVAKYDKNRLLYRKYCDDTPFLALGFKDYLKFSNEVRSRLLSLYYFPGIEMKHDIGFCAVQLIYLLAPNPQAIMELPADQFIDFFKNGGHQDWLKNVQVIHTENLNQELYQFLLQIGHPKWRIEFILSERRKNTSEFGKKNWRDFYDDELLRYVYRKNWIFFEMFPEYQSELVGLDLNFKRP